MGFIDLAELNRSQQLPLGQHPTSGKMFVMREADRFSGTYILGVAGGGKTALIKNMARSDITAGRAVVVIDPHGDLTNDLLAEMPPERVAQTYVLDMEDERYPFGINVFGLSGKPKSLKETSQAVDRVMHIFEVLFADVLKQQHLPLYVKTATIALIDNPGMTLPHMRRFLTDKPFRDSLMRGVTDSQTHEHWHDHDRLSPSEQTARIQPLLNRLGALFIGRDLIQNIMGQPTTISFRRAIENHEIVFVKLPTTTLEQDARLLGTIIVAQISAALFSFADLPEAQRRSFSLYVDEFQNFATPDFAKMFTEGRKFGMRVTLAHQLRGQLPKKLAEATASARTKVCFQLKADDAREMAQYFPAPDKAEAHVTALLLDDPGADPYLRQFTDHYLRPLQSQRKAGKIKMGQAGPGLASVLWLGYDEAKKAAKKAEPVTADDPTQYLDDLLRDVMQTHDPDLPVPPKAVIGFANCGRGFYGAVKNLRPCLELTADYQFPPQLLAGDQWRRAPKNDYEQFLQFVFCLRGAMRTLAAHPIGKKAEATNAGVAQLLTQLPRRHALVRSGDDVGRIYTYDTPSRLAGPSLQERIRTIQDQTRAKYCHSHEQVQQLWRLEREPAQIGASTTNGGMPKVAGWGEVGEP